MPQCCHKVTTPWIWTQKKRGDVEDPPPGTTARTEWFVVNPLLSDDGKVNRKDSKRWRNLYVTDGVQRQRMSSRLGGGNNGGDRKGHQG